MHLWNCIHSNERKIEIFFKTTYVDTLPGKFGDLAIFSAANGVSWNISEMCDFPHIIYLYRVYMTKYDIYVSQVPTI